MKKRLLLLFLCCHVNLLLFAQTPILDNLKATLSHQYNPSERLETILQICNQNNSMSADSLQYYVNQGLALTNNSDWRYDQLKSNYIYYYLKLAKTKEANAYIDSLLTEKRGMPIKENVLKDIKYNKIVSLIRNNELKLAIDSSLNLLKYAEATKDTLYVMRAYSALGWAHMELESEHEAVNWLRKGINYSSNKDYHIKVNSLYLNIASCYKVMSKYDSAFFYIQQGLEYAMEGQYLTNQANALNIRAGIYSKSKKLNEAQQDLEQALVIRKKVGDLHYIVGDMGMLSSFYTFNKQPLKAIPVAKEGYLMAEKTGNLYKMVYLQKCLANAYHEAGMYKESADVFYKLVDLKDSLYEKNTAEALSEMSTKYDLQKKENIIIQQKSRLLQSKFTTYAILLALISSIIITYILYRNYKHRRDKKMEIALAEERLHSTEAVKKAEENERKRIAADLHDNLGSYAAAIASNIRYLKENSNQNNQTLIDQLDENAQGIVAQLGDSIWILKNEELPLTKLADRFKSWIQKLLMNYPQVKYFYEENINQDITFTPVTILNLFLILKEGVTNSLKHSDGDVLKISFDSNENIEIKIEDNGKGLQTNLINKGSGIEHIKYRAKECGLQVRWQQLTPHGTSMILYNTTN